MDENWRFLLHFKGETLDLALQPWPEGQENTSTFTKGSPARTGPDVYPTARHNSQAFGHAAVLLLNTHDA